MPSRALTTVPKSYADLKRAVLAVALKGRRNADRAWLLTYHEIGRLISEHLLLNQDRADYGTQVIPRLAGDTGISVRSLYECRQFYRYFPILRTSAELGWSHYVLLCQVADATQREALAV